MSFGDTGGSHPELIITMRTPKQGPVDIRKGDPVALIGSWTIDNGMCSGPLFGQANADCDKADAAIPVIVHGVVKFSYDCISDTVGSGLGYGVSMCCFSGRVNCCNNQCGKVIAVNEKDHTVWVLL